MKNPPNGTDVADGANDTVGETAALALLARIVEGAGVATAWTVLGEDGILGLA